MTGQPLSGMDGWPAAAKDPRDAQSLATEATVSRFRAALDKHGTGPGPRPEDVPGEGIVRALLARLGDHATRDVVVNCPHTDDDSDEPVFWLPSIPGAYLCGPCLTTAPTPIDCDSCSSRSLALTRWVGAVGGRTTVVYFLCPTCSAAVESGGAR